ncbi:DUF305 domain-containing protein [Aggregatilinea lenta]|uniref:DUF305 domain-containing protein n=1 Tax=Aggregatilinea lenta TaxID=913108 RepID=UPI000E5B4BFD|nr:DUF305 domain-containing protein [Aggregatilinea lenta]
MVKRMQVWLVLLAVLVSAVAGTAYAQGDVTGRAARAEVRFMEGMIDHHQMALDMAEHCLAKTSSDAVRTLCQGVIDAQTPEIELMRGWLTDWYGIDYTPVPMAQLMDWMGLGAASGMMDMGHGDHTANPLTDMPLMMGMMSGFDRIEGADYDAAWLEAMIDHHDDAVHMATRVLRYAEHEDLRALAQQIIDDQTAEIELMEDLIVTLSAAE